MESVKEFRVILYSCSIPGCSKEYKSKFNLKQYVEFNHLGKKTFICAACGRAFVCKQNLVEHQFIHSGVKPYKCNYCEMMFRQASQLYLHKRTHNSDYQSTLQFAEDLNECQSFF